MFANDPGDRGSIPGQVISETQKMALDATLLNIQDYQVCIKVKWSNPGKRVAIEKGANFTFLLYIHLNLFKFFSNEIR